MSHYARPCGLHLKITFQIPATEEEWRGVGCCPHSCRAQAANKGECLIPAFQIIHQDHKGIRDFFLLSF